MEVDAALTSLGKYGKWQLIQLFTISLFTAGFRGNIGIGIVFQGWMPPHHCNVAQNTTWNGSVLYVINLTDQCHTSPNETDTCQGGFTFESDGYYTIIEQFNWICDLQFMNALTLTIYYFGLMLGSLLIPPFADYFGRKYAVIIPCILGGVFHLLAAIIVHPVAYMVFRFISGIFIEAMYICGFVHVCEQFPADMRAFASNFRLVMWSLGLLLNGMFGYFIKSWRTFQIIAAVLPMGIFFGIWLLDESIPWLVANSRGSEALVILKKAAKINRCHVEDDVIVSFKNAAGLNNDPDDYKGKDIQNFHTKFMKVGKDFKDIFCHRSVEKEAITLLDILKHKQLRLYLILGCFIRCFTSFLYVGLTLSTPVMAGGRFLNYFLGAAVEFPSPIFAHILLARVGRRQTVIGLLILTGIVLISTSFCPTKLGAVDLVPMVVFLNATGKFCCTAAVAGIYVHICELYPTNFRIRGLGFASVFAYLGAMAAPYVEYLAHKLPWIPGVLFGSIAFLAAALVLPLPETKGKPLPQTIDDVTTSQTSRSKHCATEEYLLSNGAVAMIQDDQM